MYFLCVFVAMYFSCNFSTRTYRVINKSSFGCATHSATYWKQSVRPLNSSHLYLWIHKYYITWPQLHFGFTRCLVQRGKNNLHEIPSALTSSMEGSAVFETYIQEVTNRIRKLFPHTKNICLGLLNILSNDDLESNPGALRRCPDGALYKNHWATTIPRYQTELQFNVFFLCLSWLAVV